ncbi:MAG: hypothetical protein LBQ24_06085 [Candidatus Peribacteria bacterium]|jgi:hypothetical protein|nr:hypothetical protein [Candidatus Peribacteria bacterium]
MSPSESKSHSTSSREYKRLSDFKFLASNVTSLGIHKLFTRYSFIKDVYITFSTIFQSIYSDIHSEIFNAFDNSIFFEIVFVSQAELVNVTLTKYSQ